LRTQTPPAPLRLATRGRQAQGLLEDLLLRLRRCGAPAVAAIFAEVDAHKAGRLEFSELARCVKRLLPSITTLDQRVFLAFVRTSDVEGTGQARAPLRSSPPR